MRPVATRTDDRCARWCLLPPAVLLFAACAAPEPAAQVRLRGDPWYGTQSRYDYREAGDTQFTFDTILGARMMTDEAAWRPVDDQFEVGLQFQTPLRGSARHESGSPLDVLSWDFGLRYAFDNTETQFGTSTTSIDTDTYDLSGGIHLSPFSRRAPVEPYLSAGVALLYVDNKLESAGIRQRDTDSIVAGYLRGGLRIDLGRGRHVGLDIRWISGGDARVDGLNADTEATTVSFIFGTHF